VNLKATQLIESIFYWMTANRAAVPYILSDHDASEYRISLRLLCPWKSERTPIQNLNNIRRFEFSYLLIV